MKFAITILVCLGFAVAATTLPEFRIANKGFLEKQKFLLEIVYRVMDPLMFDEWIKLGTTFVTDRSYYKVSKNVYIHSYMYLKSVLNHSFIHISTMITTWKNSGNPTS